MRSEDLITKVGTPHGVDFISVGGGSSRTDGTAAKRRRSRKEARENPGGGEDAKGSSSRTSKLLGNLLETFGLASRGVGVRTEHGERQHECAEWCAVLWSLDISRGLRVRRILHNALLLECAKLAERYEWPDMARQRNGEYACYREDLCKLVLLEEIHKAKFDGNDERFANTLHVNLDTWRKELQPKYQSLRVTYERWFNSARGQIQRRLNGIPDDSDYAEAG